MNRKLRITVAGKAYEVEVEILDETARGPAARPASPARVTSAPVSAPVSQAAPRPAADAGAGSLPSPLAGKVVSISVKVGDAVSQGDTVIVLEAMKMNTLVTAQASGTISAILVKPGDAIEEGQALITIS